jgi:hypothetical protein
MNLIKYNIKTHLLFFLILIVLSSCEFGNPIGERYSANIKQSENIDVFIHEYNPKKITINDSIKISIISIIAEKKHGIYSYDKDAPYSIDSTKSQLVLTTEPGWGELWKKYGYRETWDFSNMRSVRKYTWVIDIDAPIPPDTVSIEVIRRHIDSTGRPGIHYGEKIGEFTIVKKKNTE